MAANSGIPSWGDIVGVLKILYEHGGEAASVWITDAIHLEPFVQKSGAADTFINVN